MKNIFKLVLALTLSGTMLQANAALPVYKFTDLGASGGVNSYANAINNLGQVVGFIATDSVANATLWSNSQTINLGTSGGTSSYAYAINNSGQVVGQSIDGNSVSRATLWNGTTAINLGTLGGTNSNALAINDAGQIVGRSSTADNFVRATLWDGTNTYELVTSGRSFSDAYGINSLGQIVGTVSEFDQNNNITSYATLWNGTSTSYLGTLGGNKNFSTAINNTGQIVGGSTTADNVYHATLWDGTTTTDIGIIAGTNFSRADAINNIGQVVGYGATAGYQSRRALLWNGPSAYDLNSFLDDATVAEGWVLMEANGINDNGWIVGSASNSLLGIRSHAFLLAPVSEPETYCMLLMGLGLMGFIARKRNQ